MAFFILKNRTGASFRPPGVVIPGMSGPPLEVSEEVAKKIRALKNPKIIECDAKGKPVLSVPKPAPKKKAASGDKKVKAKKKAPLLGEDKLDSKP